MGAEQVTYTVIAEPMRQATKQLGCHAVRQLAAGQVDAMPGGDLFVRVQQFVNQLRGEPGLADPRLTLDQDHPSDAATSVVRSPAQHAELDIPTDKPSAPRRPHTPRRCQAA